MGKMTDPEEFWRKHINDLSDELPADGKPAPELETIKPATKKEPLKEGNRKVLVHKVLTSIYVITDVNGKVYTANTSQKMIVLGTMTLARALKLAQEDDLP